MTVDDNKFQRRLESRLGRYSARFMNDTKWREVLLVLAHYRRGFAVATVHNEKFNAHDSFVRENLLSRTGVKDSGFGGPIEYREIFAIRIRRFVSARNPTTGAPQMKSDILPALQRLGELPLKYDEATVSIHGYRS